MKHYFIHNHNMKIYTNDDIPITLEELSMIEEGSCEYIDINNYLDFIPYQERDKVLSVVLKKIKHGGKVSIDGFEIVAIAQFICNYKLDIDNANDVLFNGRKSCVQLNDLLKRVAEHGFVFSMVKIDSCKYFVEAERP